MTTNIRLFGTCRVIVNDIKDVPGSTNESHELLVPGGKPRELLAYLVLHARRLHPRDALADLLFPDADPYRARRNLSDALYRLRLSFGADWLIATNDYIGLDMRSLTVDVWQFESAHDDIGALDLYEGDLAEDLDAVWLLAPRARLRELCLLRFEQACCKLTESSQFTHALTLANRWTSLDPLSEEAHCTAMRLYARLGRFAAALGHFDTLSRALAEELGAHPTPSAHTLAELIRSEFEARVEGAINAPAFVGRRNERRCLAELAERAQAGCGSVVVLEGEPGIGKSRLLEVVAETLSWRGFDIAWGQNQTTSASYSPLEGALLSAITGPHGHQIRDALLAKLSPAALDALSIHMPKLLPSERRTASRSSVTHRNPQLVLPQAIAESIAVLTDVRPQALLLDDVHLANADFWQVMQLVASRIGERRLLVLLAARGDELRRNDHAWRSVRQLDGETDIVHLSLGGLTQTECAHLARSISQVYECDAGDVEALHRHTQGNPLFIIESLRHPEHAIVSFQASLERRLRLLSSGAQRALQAAAVLGREFRHGTWQAVAQAVYGVEVQDVIDEVLVSHFAHETQRGYAFQHDLTHRHVYDAIAPAKAQTLHSRAGEVLMLERAESEIIAGHFEHARRWRDALRFWREAGDRAVQAHAYANALGHYERAFGLLQLLPPDMADAERLALLCRRQGVLGMLVRTSEWLADLQEIELLASATDDAEARLVALEARITLHVYGTNLTQMRATAQQALDLARSLGDTLAEARIGVTLGTHLVNVLGRPDEALPLLNYALAQAEARGDDPLLALAQCNLSLIQRFSGECTAACDTALKALALIDTQPALAWARPNALQALGSAAWFLADFPRALQALGDAFRMHIDSGNAFAAGDAGLNLALVYASCGQAGQALGIVDQLATLMSQMHLPSNSDMSLWLHALSAECHILADDLAGARRVLNVTGPCLDEAQPSRAQLLAWQAMGRLRLAEGRNAEAESLLAQATRVFTQGTTVKVEPALLHAIAAQRAGLHDVALASLHLAECRLKDSDYALVRPLLHFARFEVLGDEGELRLAHETVQQQAACFGDAAPSGPWPSPCEPRSLRGPPHPNNEGHLLRGKGHFGKGASPRLAFVERVPLHREIETRWRACAHPAKQMVRLARADAPLGRALTDAQQVAVVWTVDAGEDDAAVLNANGLQMLRRARLERLIAEAHAQGAAPTHTDLAEALGVNVRTVARDLAATGFIGTRRNKSKLDTLLST